MYHSRHVRTAALGHLRFESYFNGHIDLVVSTDKWKFGTTLSKISASNNLFIRGITINDVYLEFPMLMQVCVGE